MNNITKLAKLLTADFFVWEQNKQTNEMKCQNIDNILNDKINLLLKKIPLSSAIPIRLSLTIPVTL